MSLGQEQLPSQTPEQQDALRPCLSHGDVGPSLLPLSLSPPGPGPALHVRPSWPRFGGLLDPVCPGVSSGERFPIYTEGSQLADDN